MLWLNKKQSSATFSQAVAMTSMFHLQRYEMCFMVKMASCLGQPFHLKHQRRNDFQK